jgi:hypothetical protein
MCVCHDATDAFRRRCTHASHQYKVSLVNLSQRDSWVAQGRLMGNQNWVRFCHRKAWDNINFLVAKHAAINFIFLVVNHNKGNPSMTQDFLVYILTNATTCKDGCQHDA